MKKVWLLLATAFACNTFGVFAEEAVNLEEGQVAVAEELVVEEESQTAEPTEEQVS